MRLVGRGSVNRLLHSSVGQTMSSNYLNMGMVAVAGVLLARGLGEADRGHYAAIVAWYGVAATVGALGQNEALTYHIARHRARTRANVVRSRRIWSSASMPIFVVGIFAAVQLADHSPLVVLAYRIAFLAIPVTAFFGPYFASFQAFRISTWNVIRIVQPTVNLAGVFFLFVFGELDLIRAVMCLLASNVAQLLVAAALFRRAHRGEIGELGGDELLGYGLRQSGATIPGIVSTNLDRLVLSLAVAPGQLGQYAVAQSAGSLVAPVGSAIASVVFPRLSARRGGGGRRSEEIRAVWLTIGGSVPFMAMIVLVSPWLIPLVFGAAYRPAVHIVAWVAPAILVQGLVTVSSALLRARGRPGSASIAQTVALCVGAVSSVVAVAAVGVVGAALGSLAGSVTALLLMAHMLREEPREERPPLGVGESERV